TLFALRTSVSAAIEATPVLESVAPAPPKNGLAQPEPNTFETLPHGHGAPVPSPLHKDVVGVGHGVPPPLTDNDPTMGKVSPWYIPSWKVYVEPHAAAKHT